MRRAVVIQHIAFEDLGTLAPALVESEFAIETLDAAVSDLTGIERDPPDLLVVLGGPISVYQEAAYPFLTDELRLIARRVERNLPVIGICLGAQLLAAAAGARVFAGGNGKEIGWAPVFPTAAFTPANPLAELFQGGLNIFHWHGDTFDLPSGAEHLAHSAQYPNQAFSLGDFALALQFHIEVRPHQIEHWLIGHAAELAQAGVDVPDLRSLSRRFAPALAGVAPGIWRRWLEAVFRQ